MECRSFDYRMKWKGRYGMKLKEILKGMVVAGIAVTIGNAYHTPAFAASESRPNVILFYADDLGWTDLSSFGSTFYETPNLDRLAAKGMRFTSSYAPSSVCTPSRAALLTGRTPARLGITDYASANTATQDLQQKRQRNRNQNHMFLEPPSDIRLPEGSVTFADVFKEAGYHTFFLGKWHVGNPEDGYGPTDHGFDVNIAGTARGGPYGRGGYFHPFDLPNIDSEPGDHLTDRMAEEAIKLIEGAGTEPFFMYFSFYDVHTPLMTKDHLEEKYRKKAAPLHLGPRFASEPPRWNRQVHDHAVYAGMIETMDEALGAIVTALEEKGLDENTIIVFSSDHGGLSTSEGHPTSNLPLRAGKGWLYEGGVRVPTLFYWPGVTEPGSRSDEPHVQTDFFPTMLEMAGLAMRPEDHLDGVSLVSELKGEGASDRERIFWHHPHYSPQGGSPAGAMREGDWKLVEFFEGRRLELYNLAEDIEEQNDLARRYPRRVMAMHEKLREWRDEVGALYPEANPNFDPSRGRGDAHRTPPGGF